MWIPAVLCGFVLDLAAGSGAGGDLHHVLCRDWQAGHESAVVGGFSFFIGDCDRQQVDVQRILAVAQRDRFDSAVAIGEGALAGLALAHCVLVQRRSLIFIPQQSTVPCAGK
jgi:hypothetical protein